MGSLLIKPVQRIMKYPLLLRELWQATPEDHPDCRPLQEAFTAAKIINVNINEFKRRKDIGNVTNTRTIEYFLIAISKAKYISFLSRPFHFFSNLISSISVYLSIYSLFSVMKYKRLEDEGTLRGKLHKFNIHSIRKKGDRFAGYLKILTGVEPQVK